MINKKQHNLQHEIWDSEHKKPFMFPFVDSTEPNPGVVLFWEWLNVQRENSPLKGLDVCCGKGRNAIWLAGKGINMDGFDFSEIAITEAKRRKQHLALPGKINFQIHDAFDRWSYDDHQFDFVIDCFGSADIESQEGRDYVLNETYRVLKPNGYYFLQIDTPEIGFFAERFNNARGIERNTLVFPNGKIESILTEEDIAAWSHPLKLIDVRREIESTHEIFGQTQPYKYFWIITQATIG